MTPELAIRAARSAFNTALASADLEAIRPLLAPSAVLVTGSDSALISGRQAQLATWKQAFRASDRILYTRLPDQVIASSIEPIAFEHGHWTGVSVTTGRELASGIYTAKWRQFGVEWRIEAELYLTLG